MLGCKINPPLEQYTASIFKIFYMTSQDVSRSTAYQLQSNQFKTSSIILIQKRLLIKSKRGAADEWK
jgi:hypothetical protein